MIRRIAPMSILSAHPCCCPPRSSHVLSSARPGWSGPDQTITDSHFDTAQVGAQEPGPT